MEIVEQMGCDPQGLLSVLNAKADPLQTSSKHKHDKHSMNQKVNRLASPTFIFRSPRHLKYFLDHFMQCMQGYLPPFVIGHSAVAIPAGATTANYKSAPITLRDFLATTGRTFHLYLSNIRDDCHTSAIGNPHCGCQRIQV